MAENNQQFQCTGDCLKCFPAQRQYCASQHAYNSMRMIERMEQKITDIENHFRDLTKMVESIQDNEATLFNPLGQEIAQEGEGAEVIVPQDSLTN